MDLKSMLNESAGQKGPPRISTQSSTHSHTPRSSYDARIEHTPSSDIGTSARPTPYGPPPHTGESRAQGGVGGGGGYFPVQSHSHSHSQSQSQSQSPYPNAGHSASASTPSAGPPSAYAQSPSSYAGTYTPRDSLPPAPYPAPIHNPAAPLVSPSPSGSGSAHYPLTPVSAHHHQPSYAQLQPQLQSQQHPNYPQQIIHSQQSNGFPAQYQHQQFQSPPPPYPRGLPPSQARQLSPSQQFQSQPATPLGPPLIYPRASPHRPLSQGGPPEGHLRRASQSSVGSALSRDHTHQPPPVVPELVKRESTNRSYLYDTRERSRSESVSPKTIPRPPPQRTSTGSLPHTNDHSSIAPQQHPQPAMSHRSSLERQAESFHVSHPSSDHARHSSIDAPVYQSPAPVIAPTPMPAPSATSIRKSPTVKEEPQQSLKRSASHLSDTKPPPQKRPRGERPIWVQSARRNRPLRFIDAPQRPDHQHQHQQSRPPQARPPPVPRHENPPPPRQNGTGGPPREQNQPVPEPRWPATFAGPVPLEHLTKTICDWIAVTTHNVQLPVGSLWEIEAKVGNIIDNNTNERIFLPFTKTEMLLNREAVRTKWDSRMNIEQHKALNGFLNQLVQENAQERHTDPATPPIDYKHPKENDEFYELNEEGKTALRPELLQIIHGAAARTHHRREVRVRRTVDKETGQLTASIIKTRIADEDIYNPGWDFDFRISISLETQWNGRVEHLVPVQQQNRGRHKDRVSYRHMMYQIDLTQVSYEDSQDLEHELEVEIGTEAVRQELTKLARGEANNYERMIRGLVDNVRMLCRRATLKRR